MPEQELIMTTIRLPVPLYERLRRESFERRMSQVEIVRLALEEYLAVSKKPGGETKEK